MNVERVEQFSSVRWWQALNPAVYLVSILPGVAVWLLAEWQQDAELIAAVLAAVTDDDKRIGDTPLVAHLEERIGAVRDAASD